MPDALRTLSSPVDLESRHRISISHRGFVVYCHIHSLGYTTCGCGYKTYIARDSNFPVYFLFLQQAKERVRTPAKNYVPGSGALRAKNLNPKTPKSGVKRPNGAAGSSVKKVHSNTFCTPSKIRKLDYGKLNSTIAPGTFNKPALPPPPAPAPVIVAPPTKAALQKVQAMLPPPLPAVPRFSDLLEKDFDTLPADSRSSMFSLNLSSSTSVDQPISSCSSVITQSTK